MLGIDSEHATSALNTAVCHAVTEATIVENSPKYSSPSMGAVDVANQLVEGQIRTIRGRLERVLKIDINITTGTEPSLTVTRHAVPSKEGHTEEKWSSWMSRFTVK